MKKLFIFILFISVAFGSLEIVNINEWENTVLEYENDYNGDGESDVYTEVYIYNNTEFEIFAISNAGGGYKWSSAICSNIDAYSIEKFELGNDDTYTSTGNLQIGKLSNYGMSSEWCPETNNYGFILFSSGSGTKQFYLKTSQNISYMKFYTGSGSEERVLIHQDYNMLNYRMFEENKSVYNNTNMNQIVRYDYSYEEANITLYKNYTGLYDNIIDDVFVYYDNITYKFGANDSSNMDIAMYKYELKSTLPIRSKRGNVYSVYKSKDVYSHTESYQEEYETTCNVNPHNCINVTDEFGTHEQCEYDTIPCTKNKDKVRDIYLTEYDEHDFDFSDICNKNNSNCTFVMSDDMLEVYFYSDSEIDPAISYSQSEVGSESLNTDTVSQGNFTRLTINNNGSSIYDNLVGYWSFDADNIGAFEDAQVNEGAVFDGDGDYVDVGTSIATISNGTSQISMSAWVKTSALPSTDSNGGAIVATRIDSSDAGAELYFRNSGGTDYIRMAGRSQNTDSYQNAIAPFPGINQWVHIVGINDYANSRILIYINGSLITNDSVSFGSTTYVLGSPSENDVIGTLPVLISPYFFNGTIDEVMIFNRTLSSSEITEMYNNHSQGLKAFTDDANLVGYWDLDKRFTDSSGNGNDGVPYGDLQPTTAYDFSGKNNHGTYFGNAYADYTTLYDDALTLDGDGDYVDAGYNQELNFSKTDGIFTASVWVKQIAISPNSVPVGQMGGPEGWMIYQDSGNRIIFFNYGFTNNKVIATQSFPLNNWSHIVALSNSTDICIFIDGNLDSCASKNGGTYNHPEVTPLLMGAYNTADDTIPNYKTFNGSIDEVMIFNTSLTQAEIQAIYNNQSPRFKPSGKQELKQINMNGTYNRVNVTYIAEENLGSDVNVSIHTWNVSKGYKNYDLGEHWLELDGAGDYVETVSTTHFSVSDISVSAWVYANDIGNSGQIWFSDTIVQRYARDPPFGWKLGLDDEGKPIWLYFNDGCTVDSISSSGSSIVGEWHYVTGVRNGTNLVLYVDGIQKGIIDKTCADQTLAWPLLIGRWRDDISSSDFNGSIDEVMIFNSTLTQSEITHLYNLGRDIGYYDHANLVSWWSFDKNLNSTHVEDKKANNHGKFVDNAFINSTNDGFVGYWHADDYYYPESAFVSGIINNGLYLERTNNDYLQTQTLFNLSSNQSISLWINATALRTEWNMFTGTTVTDAGDNHLAINNNNLIRMKDANSNIIDWSTTINLNQLYHIVIARNDTHWVAYQDSVSLGNRTVSGDFLIDSIGNGYYSLTAFLGWQGVIDEFMIFNKTLTSQEVSQIYQNQSNGSRILEDDPNLLGYWYFDDDYKNKVNDNEVYKGNGNVSLKTKDTSGNNNNGSYIGNIYHDNGIYDNSFVFNGDEHIRTKDIYFENEITVSAWVNSDIVETNNQKAVVKDDTADTREFILAYSSVGVQWSVFNSTSTIKTALTSDSIQNNVWYHILGTYDGSMMKTYVNGVLGANISHSGSINDGTNPIMISYTDSKFDGQIDEVMIWNRSLSASEVKELYIKGRAKFEKSIETKNTNENFDTSGAYNIIAAINYYSDPDNFYTPITHSGININYFNSGSTTTTTTSSTTTTTLDDCTYGGSGNWLIQNNCTLSITESIQAGFQTIIDTIGSLFIDNTGRLNTPALNITPHSFPAFNLSRDGVLNIT